MKHERNIKLNENYSGVTYILQLLCLIFMKSYIQQHPIFLRVETTPLN